MQWGSESSAAGRTHLPVEPERSLLRTVGMNKRDSKRRHMHACHDKKKQFLFLTDSAAPHDLDVSNSLMYDSKARGFIL